MYKCPKCNKTYSVKYAFCEECGTRLEEQKNTKVLSSGQPDGSKIQNTNVENHTQPLQDNQWNQQSQQTGGWNQNQIQQQSGGWNNPMPQQQKKGSNKGLIITIIILLVVLLAGGGVAGWYFYSQSQEDSDDDDDRESRSSDSKKDDEEESDKKEKDEKKESVEDEEEEEEQDVDLLELTDTYLEAMDYLDGYEGTIYQTSDGNIGMTSWDSPEGVLTRVVDDFDGDKEEECLVLTLENDCVVATMYQLADDSLEECDSIVLESSVGVASIAESYTVIYLNPMDKGINISYEHWDSTTVEVADGQDRIYTNLHYKDGSFIRKEEYSGCGSDWSDSEAPSVAAGYLDTTDYYYSDMIYNWNQRRVIPICEIGGVIDEGYIADYTAIASFVASSSGEQLPCGTRLIVDDAPDGTVNLKGKTSVAPSVAAKPAATIAPAATAVPAAGDYVIPDSSVRYLTQAELALYTKDQLRIARNEIYARHGRMFLDEALQAYFNSKSWYIPSIPADAFQQSMLNEVEKANATLILEYENSLP